MRSAERSFVALLGTLLLGTGIYAAFCGAVGPPWAQIGGFLLAMLGGNAIYAAVTDQRPWILLIGPLP